MPIGLVLDNIHIYLYIYRYIVNIIMCRNITRPPTISIRLGGIGYGHYYTSLLGRLFVCY